MVGRFILKGGVSGWPTGSDPEGISDSWYSSSSELREIGSSSSSSSKLPDLLTDSSAFLFVRCSICLCASWLIVLGVDRLPGMFVHGLPVVGVVRFSSPPVAQVLKEAMSSVLISEIASCNKGSG